MLGDEQIDQMLDTNNLGVQEITPKPQQAKSSLSLDLPS